MTSELESGFPFISYPFFAFIFGLIIGSFLNVVIRRVPRGESIVFPGSRCPACGNPIRSIDNIPLISYLLLRGRCHNCDMRISLVYPTVEFLTGLIFAAIIYKTDLRWEALLDMVFASVMLALIFIDALHRLLPNLITYPAFIFAMVAATVRGGWGEQPIHTFDISILFTVEAAEFVVWRAALFGGLLFVLAAPGFWMLDRLDLILFNKFLEWEEMDEEPEAVDKATDHRYRRAVITTMILGLALAVIWAVAVIKFSPNDKETYESAYDGLLRASVSALIGSGFIWWLRAAYFYIRGLEGMGLGDVKMMSIIGAFLGWQSMFSVLLLGSILGVVIGLVLAYRSKRGLKTALPFGVCLGVAALIVLLMG